jgi:hypothetical protein
VDGQADIAQCRKVIEMLVDMLRHNDRLLRHIDYIPAACQDT